MGLIYGKMVELVDSEQRPYSGLGFNDGSIKELFKHFKHTGAFGLGRRVQIDLHQTLQKSSLQVYQASIEIENSSFQDIYKEFFAASAIFNLWKQKVFLFKSFSNLF